MKIVLTEESIAELISCLQVAKTACAPKLIEMLREQSKSTLLMDRIREEAKRNYAEDGVLEFDDNCTVSISDDKVPDGAYVQGWTWVPNPDLDEPNPIKVEHLNCEIVGLLRGKYTNNGALVIAAKLRWPKPDAGDPEFDDHIISVNITDYAQTSDKLNDGLFYAKSWSENETIFQALVDNGIIQEVGGSAPAGHATAPLCIVTPKGMKWMEELKQ